MITDKNTVVQNVPILRDDRVFKTFFKQNKKRLAFLIKNVTGYDFDYKDITFIDSEIPGETIYEKTSRLDLYIKLRNGDKINVEMQNILDSSFALRRLYYSNKSFNETIKRNNGYSADKVISIYMLYDKKRFPYSLINFHKYDRISLEIEKNINCLKDEVLIDEFIVNLAYLEKDKRINKEGQEFLNIFNIPTVEEISVMCDKNEEYKDVYEDLLKITESELFQVQSTMQEKVRRDREQLIIDTKNEGLKQGKEEGLEQGKKDVIKNLYKLNFEIDVIAKAVCLSEKEVKEIIKNM